MISIEKKNSHLKQVCKSPNSNECNDWNFISRNKRSMKSWSNLFTSNIHSYKFVMTNGKSYDYFHYHFSADEFYILPILMVASALHLFLLFTTTWFAIALKTRQLFHVTYKLFLITVFLHVSRKSIFVHNSIAYYYR